MHLLYLDQLNLVLVSFHTDQLSIYLVSNYEVLLFQVILFHINLLFAGSEVLQEGLKILLALRIYWLVCFYLLFDVVDFAEEPAPTLVVFE